MMKEKVWRERGDAIFALGTPHGGAPPAVAGAAAAYGSAAGVSSYLTNTEFNSAVHPARALFFSAYRSEVLVYPSGRVVVVATRRTEAETLKLLQQCLVLVGEVAGVPIETRPGAIVHADVGFDRPPALLHALAGDLLWLDKLGPRYATLSVQYEPSLLPAAVVTMRTTSATLTIFESGRVLVSARNAGDAATALDRFCRVYVEGRALTEEAAIEQEEEARVAAAAAAAAKEAAAAAEAHAAAAAAGAGGVVAGAGGSAAGIAGGAGGPLPSGALGGVASVTPAAAAAAAARMAGDSDDDDDGDDGAELGDDGDDDDDGEDDVLAFARLRQAAGRLDDDDDDDDDTSAGAGAGAGAYAASGGAAGGVGSVAPRPFSSASVPGAYPPGMGMGMGAGAGAAGIAGAGGAATSASGRAVRQPKIGKRAGTALPAHERRVSFKGPGM